MIGPAVALIGKGIAAVISVAIEVDRAITWVKPYLRKLPRAQASKPLPFKDVRRINDIANRAGHEHEARK